MQPFCCYSSSENIDCHNIINIQAARKKYANNIKCTLDFYCYSQFYMAPFQTATHGVPQHLLHIYLFGVSINRMLILQLNIFLSVKFMF